MMMSRDGRRAESDVATQCSPMMKVRYGDTVRAAYMYQLTDDDVVADSQPQERVKAEVITPAKEAEKEQRRNR